MSSQPSHPWRSRLIVIARVLLIVVIIAAPIAWALGCTTTIVPPGNLQDPVPVLLMDHGYTPSLVLPVDDQQRHVARYAYGEYRYYALEERGFTGAIRALFWPTPGALGRRVVAGPNEPSHVNRMVNVGSENIYVIHAERADVQRLREQLDRTFEANSDTEVVNVASDLVFVGHPKRYTLFYNSNHAVADWLEQLGCEVRGPAIVSRWQVVEP